MNRSGSRPCTVKQTAEFERKLKEIRAIPDNRSEEQKALDEKLFWHGVLDIIREMIKEEEAKRRPQ